MNKTVKFFISLLLVSLLLVAPRLILAADIDVKAPDQGVKEGKIGNLFSIGINIAIGLAALAAFAYLIWGGIQWITSGGDKSQYEAARNRITYALVGLAIVAAAWAIFKLAVTFLGFGDITKINVPSVND